MAGGRLLSVLDAVIGVYLFLDTVYVSRKTYLHAKYIPNVYMYTLSTVKAASEKTKATDNEICPYMSSEVPDWILSVISSIVTHFSSVDTAVFNLDL